MYTKSLIEEYIETYKEHSKVKYIGAVKTRLEYGGQKRDLILLGNDSGINVVMVGNGRELIGKCYFNEKGNYLWIGAIQVLRNNETNFRGLGIGRAIITFAKDIAKYNNLDTIALNSTRNAYNFYKGIGFKETPNQTVSQSIKTMYINVGEGDAETSYFSINPNYRKQSPSMLKNSKIQL